jgi:hypothetical protein
VDRTSISDSPIGAGVVVRAAATGTPSPSAPTRSQAIAAGLAGLLLALVLWGGRLDLPLAVSVATTHAPAARSANSQLAHTASRGVNLKLAACHRRSQAQQTRARYAAACAPVAAASGFSAAASAP